MCKDHFITAAGKGGDYLSYFINSLSYISPQYCVLLFLDYILYY